MVAPTLILNPRHDARFVAVAEAIILEGVASPGKLQERLRRHYPQVVVRPRELTGEVLTVWYVYRDGYWTSSPEGTQEEADGV
jgi:hypothetical protein